MLGQADLSSENAVLSVQNGTDTPGLALRTAEQMRGAGFTVPDSAVGNPPYGGGGRYPQTFIYDYTGGKKPASISRILTLLKLPADRVRTSGGTHPAGIDIEIVLGEDAAK